MSSMLDTFQRINALGAQAERWVWDNPALTGGCLGSVMGLAFVAGQLARRQRSQQRGSHGGSRMATPGEIRQAGLNGSWGIVLGRHRGRTLVESWDAHVLVCGPSRSGKDRRHLWPTTRRWPGSMVIVDVKERGENLEHCGQSRAKKGPVYVYAPGMERSCKYNLMDWIPWGQPEAYAAVTMLVDTLMAPQKRGERPDQNAEFFRGRGRTILRAAMLHVGAHGQRRSFGGVLGFLSDRSSALVAMAQSRNAQVRAVGLEYGALSGDELGGAWSNATNPLDPWRDPLIVANTETSDFDFATFQQGEVPQTLYLVVKSPMEFATLHGLFRAVIVQGLARLQTDWRTPQWPLLWLLNEFPQLGYMPALEAAAPVMLGRWMRLLVVIQDPGQLFETYGANTVLWSNMAAKVFHTPNSDISAKRISDMLGETTETWVSTSRQGWGKRPTRTTHQGRRKLLDMADVLGLPRSAVLIRHERCPLPIRARKLSAWRAERM